MKVTKPTKAIITALSMVLVVLTGALGDDLLSMSETTQLISIVVEAVAAVYAVWRVPNRPVEPRTAAGNRAEVAP